MEADCSLPKQTQRSSQISNETSIRHTRESALEIVSKQNQLSEEILHENVSGAYDRALAEIDFASFLRQMLDQLVLLQHGQLYVALEREAVALRVAVHQIEQVHAVHVTPFVDRFAEDVDTLVGALQVVQQGGLAAADVAFDDDLQEGEEHSVNTVT